MQQTSGEKEHGSAIVGSWTTEASASSSSSLQASQQLATCSEEGVGHCQWKLSWQLVHTGCLPDGTVLDFIPPDYTAAFVVFHFTGMFGTWGS